MELMRRPYINYDLVSKVIGRGEGVTPAMAQRIETEIRYAGYIAREERIIRDIQRHESVVIPEDFDYAPIETMTLESREKLAKISQGHWPRPGGYRCIAERLGAAEYCAVEAK